MRIPGHWAVVPVLFAAAAVSTGQTPPPEPHNEMHHDGGPALPERPSALRKALLLLRESKTAEARVELNALLKASPDDAEIWYQIARSHLMDYYRERDLTKRRIALGLAMESLNGAVKKNPDHIPALRAKAILHARSELLYYDPNLAFELASKIARLEPNANGYLLSLSEWMSGEVRFVQEGGHRVPHDPMIGIDRSVELLERVIDSTMPYSDEEAAALFMMASTLSKRGNFLESNKYFAQAAARSKSAEKTAEILREVGANLYRQGQYVDAASQFYQTLQWRMNSVDQWLFWISLKQLKGGLPPLPQNVIFPATEVKVDPANPPLLSFENMAQEMGLDRKDGNGTVAWGDYDGDGKLDVFLAGSGAFIGVYHNDGGKFHEVTEEVGLAKVPSGYSLNLIDYDNDGKLDLYISLNGWSGPLRNKLFRNVGGKFVDVSKQSGADDPGDGFISLWGDLDNDGFLDLVIANGVLKDGSVPQIYHNNGNGTFTNVTKAAGLDEPPAYGAIGIALGDYDKDGKLDILINGLEPAPNRLYHNDGNLHFTNVAEQAGVVQPTHNGFVCFFVDYNNDGFPDILTTSLADWNSTVEGLKQGYKPANLKAVHPDSNRLFRNNGNGTFTDVTWDARLYFPMGTMGAGVGDLDNDGCIDFYFGTGDPQMSRLEPNRFFHNNCDGTFSDLTNYVGFARPGNKGHGVAFVDIDEDGDLDLYAQLGGHYPGDWANNAFYRNLKGNQNNWLQLDLTGVKSNRFAVGTQVTARMGGFLVYREVKGSSGFGSTEPYRVHLGLARHQMIESLEIRWPSGLVQKFSGVAANQAIALKEGDENWTKVR
ncbi:MAG: VCBS repeat-containing protein [Acidobacteria bacterium]|nr:VCBS repeat-containing protein [Acidobacteriota bacterium]